MRIAISSPRGAPPTCASLKEALAAAEGATIEYRGRVRAQCPAADLSALATALDIREDGEPFEQIYVTPAHIVLASERVALPRLDVVPDGSVRLLGWCGFAELERPGEVMAWMAAHGVPELLDAWRHIAGEDAGERRKAWRAHLPKALRWRWRKRFELLADKGFDPDGLRRHLEKKLGSREAAIAALLRWYAAGAGPLPARPGHEELPRRILSGVGFDPVVRTAASLDDEAALAGLARYLLGAAPLSAKLAAPVLALPESKRRALLDAARARFGTDAAAELEREVFPGDFEPPPNTDLVGISQARQLTQAVTDGNAVYALDGTDVVRFENGKRIVVGWQLDRNAPLAVVDGCVVLQRNGRAIRVAPDGSEETIGSTAEFRPPASSRKVEETPGFALIDTGRATAVVRRR